MTVNVILKDQKMDPFIQIKKTNQVNEQTWDAMSRPDRIIRGRTILVHIVLCANVEMKQFPNI